MDMTDTFYHPYMLIYVVPILRFMQRTQLLELRCSTVTITVIDIKKLLSQPQHCSGHSLTSALTIMSNFRFPPPIMGGGGSGGPGLLPHPPGGPPRGYGFSPPSAPRPPTMPPRPPLMPTPPPMPRMPSMGSPSMGSRPAFHGMNVPPPGMLPPQPPQPPLPPSSSGEPSKKFDQFYSEVKLIEARDSVMTPTMQIDRLLRPGSTYFNLNPFEVLQVNLCWRFL